MSYARVLPRIKKDGRKHTIVINNPGKVIIHAPANLNIVHRTNEKKHSHHEQMSAEKAPQQKQSAELKTVSSTVADSKTLMSAAKEGAQYGAIPSLGVVGLALLTRFYEGLTCAGMNHEVYASCMNRKDGELNKIWLQMITLVFFCLALGVAVGVGNELLDRPSPSRTDNADAKENEEATESRRFKP